MDDTKEIKMSEVFSEPPESVMSRGDSFFTRTKQNRTWVRKSATPKSLSHDCHVTLKNQRPLNFSYAYHVTSFHERDQ